MSEKEDKEVLFIHDKNGFIFQERLNGILDQGGWRIADTQVSVWDNDFNAFLIRKKPEQIQQQDATENNQKCED